MAGCIGCGRCFATGRCFIGDAVNEVIARSAEFDGFVFGTPVHFASATGSLTGFMDRLFYGRTALFAYKPAAAVASCRRAGSTAALDQLNKYFAISRMPVVSSQYWNMVHGTTPEEVRRDAEGMQIMRTLGGSMAWLLRCIEAGRAVGIGLPKPRNPCARISSGSGSGDGSLAAGRSAARPPFISDSLRRNASAAECPFSDYEAKSYLCR